MSDITLGELRDYWKEATLPEIELIDLTEKIRAINPKYLSSTYLENDEYHGRFTQVRFSQTEDRNYIIYAGSFLFYTDDGFSTLKEVAEINYFNGDLIRRENQMLSSVIESMDGTIVTVGTDNRSGSKQGIVWRKPRGLSQFARSTTSNWNATSYMTNLTAGFFGQNRVKMLAFTPYPSQKLHYSIDDGVTWHSYDFTGKFASHCHEVYLSNKVYSTHNGRMWITGGDDFNNATGLNGVICCDTLNADNTLGTMQVVFAERPGYRVVGIGGNGRKTFFGNEASACGMLAISEDKWSVDNKNWEYVMGRSKLNFHEFNSICATEDGYLVSGTDGYESADTAHKGQGGHLYISKDEGASFIEIPLGSWWVNSITYDNKYFWIVTGARQWNPPSVDYSKHRCGIFRLKKPSVFNELMTPYIAKSLYVDNGNATNPLSMAPSEKSMIVDMSAYKSVVLDIETHGAGTVTVEASPFWTDPNWTSQGDITGWREITSITFTGAERKEVLLSDIQSHNKIFRIKNGSAVTPIGIKHAIFIGKK